MKILIAVDGSSYTKRMLAYLAAHDECFGAAHRYTIAHAVAPLPSRVTRALGREQIDVYHQASSEAVFKPIRAFFKQQGIAPTYVSKVGAPDETLTRLARVQKFDLLVMGSHGHGALVSLVLGSVAAKVLATCNVPVLLIR